MHIPKQTFSENLKTTFRAFPVPERTVELELVELTEGVSTPKHEQFSLLFRGPLEAFLPQRIYPVEHAKIGTFDLFLVPVGKNQEGFEYEAVFNRFPEESQSA